MTVTIIEGDCLEVMPTLPENSVDSIVTDPPYGLKFMGKDWDHSVPGVAFWVEALRVAKPGAHLLAFGGTRTFHRLACAIEDAGWELRDTLGWMYGSGFPKSHNVGLSIDKLNGCPDRGHRIATANRRHPDGTLEPNGETLPPYESVTAKQWEGWGTALKPAWEPIIMARKPLEGAVAQNVLKWGTGALNIDGCRVERVLGGDPLRFQKTNGGWKNQPYGNQVVRSNGRWPANLIHDGSQSVIDLFPTSKQISKATAGGRRKGGNSYGLYAGYEEPQEVGYGDSGSAARFFYCAKASKAEREEGCEELEERTKIYQATANGTGETSKGMERFTSHTRNHHPTVKPVALMRYLCRLVTPPNGIVLDPFCGSGSTGKAAVAEGFGFIGIELNTEYIELIRQRTAQRGLI